MTKGFSLDELAARTNLTSRTIRSYIQQGLVPGPDSLGRHAQYTELHLHRLVAIQALRRQLGWTLADIRRLLLTLSDQAIEGIARSGSLVGIPDAKLPTPPTGSALDYLQALRSAQQGVETRSSQAKRRRAGTERNLAHPRPTKDAQLSSPQTDDGGAVESLLRGLEQINGGRRVPERARAESWRRIPVTPDVELHVRGVPEGPHLRHLERIADQIRNLLMRG